MRIDDTQQSVQVLADSTMTVGRVAELVAESFGTGDRIVSCVMLENGARLPRTDPVLRHLSPGQDKLCCQLAPPAPAVPPVPAVPQIGDGELLERQIQAYLTAGRLTARDGVRSEVINTTVGFAVLAFGKGTHPLYWCCVVCFSAPFISAGQADDRRQPAGGAFCVQLRQPLATATRAAHDMCGSAPHILARARGRKELVSRVPSSGARAAG